MSAPYNGELLCACKGGTNVMPITRQSVEPVPMTNAARAAMLSGDVVSAPKLDILDDDDVIGSLVFEDQLAKPVVAGAVAFRKDRP